jgi:hypothetical protein
MTETHDSAFEAEDARLSPEAEPTPDEILEAAEEEAEAQALDAEFRDGEFSGGESSAGDGLAPGMEPGPDEADGAPEVAPEHVSLGSLEPEAAEPGGAGPEGTGVEGADDALLDDSRPRQEFGSETSDPLGAVDAFSAEETPAAEQGNRVGDEMVSDGGDDAETAQLDGDDLDVDAVADDGVLPVDTVDGLRQEADGFADEG